MNGLWSEMDGSCSGLFVVVDINVEANIVQIDVVLGNTNSLDHCYTEDYCIEWVVDVVLLVGEWGMM